MRQGTMRRVAAIAVTVLALGVAGCGEDDEDAGESEDETTTEVTTSATPTGATGATGAEGTGTAEAESVAGVASCLDDRGIEHDDEVDFYALEGEPPDAERINVSAGDSENGIVIAVFDSSEDAIGGEDAVVETGGLVDTEVVGNIVYGVDEDEAENVETADIAGVEACLPTG